VILEEAINFLVLDNTGLAHIALLHRKQPASRARAVCGELLILGKSAIRHTHADNGRSLSRYLSINLLTPDLIGAIGRLHLESVPILTVVTAALSNLVSNVPAVLVLKPFVEPLRNQQHAWLTIAMASTLAGNFTLVGSVANLIVVQSARARGVTIGFWDYFKVGAPLTLMTVAVGIFRL